MNYNEAKAFLEEISHSGIVLGLDTIKELLRRVGNPQDKLKFVHIAGTNGKGSTSAFIGKILRAAGYKTGSYTSPRVFKYEEFVQVNGENITEEAICRHVSTIKDAVDSMKADGLLIPSVFEVETTIGFLYFLEKNCDIVVLECGMGGLEDATNVVDTTVCNVFASIGLDHTGFLGNTIEEIAKTKSGIIKNSAPVCSAYQEAGVLEVLKDAAGKKDAPLYVVDINKIRLDEKSDSFELCFDYKEFKNLIIHMTGRYQLKNAALAIETCKALRTQGFDISDEAFYKGLDKARWPGRFDTISTNPRIILDGAHNPHGMKELEKSIRCYFADKKVYGIMGVLADKAYDEECEMIAPLLYKVYTITPPNNPRALDACKLAAVMKKYHNDVTVSEDIKKAVETVVKEASKDDIIIIFGSLSYIGEAYEAVNSLQNNSKLSK